MTGGCGAAALQRKATAIVNVARVIAGTSYHFLVAVLRAKEAYSKYDHRPVALRIEVVHKVDDHLILMRLMIRE